MTQYSHRNVRKPWVWVGSSAAVVLFFIFIWPTPYEYTRKAPNIYRVNRFTGVTETATAQGWRTDSELAQHREQQSKLIDAELKQKAARDAEAQRKTDMELSRVKELGEFDLGGTKTACSVSYSNYRIRFRLTLSPSGGAKRAMDSGYRSSYYINASFVDDQGFSVVTEKVTLDDFTRIVDDKGRVVHHEYEGDAFITADDYRRIVGWEPTYVWGN